MLGRRVALAFSCAAAASAPACGRGAPDGAEAPGGPALISPSGEIPMGAIGARGADVAASSASARVHVESPSATAPRRRAPPPDPFADPPEPPAELGRDGGTPGRTHGGTTL